MVQTYRTLRVAESDEGVLSVVIDAPPMNLIGPELVRDLVRLLGEVESGQETRVMVLESAHPEYFVPHADLTKVAEYTAEAPKAGGSGSWSPRTRPRAAWPPCLRRACRPMARSNSTSATASEPFDREADPAHSVWQHRRRGG